MQQVCNANADVLSLFDNTFTFTVTITATATIATTRRLRLEARYLSQLVIAITSRLCWMWIASVIPKQMLFLFRHDFDRYGYDYVYDNDSNYDDDSIRKAYIDLGR